MRMTFHGFFPLTAPEQERLLREALIVLDTNALLNLYRYTSKSRNELLIALQRLSDRLWIPYQVGLEFHSRRLELISRQHRVSGKISDILDAAMRMLEGQLGEYSTNAMVDTKPIIDTIRQQLGRLSNDVTKRGSDSAAEYGIGVSSDPLVERIASLYDGRVGRKYSDEELLQIYTEGEVRYEKGTPPGYLDKNKGAPDKFGDFVIWRQLIDHAKEIGRDVVFVTDDAKEDWWWRFEGKTIGPRPELRAEFQSLTGKIYFSYRVERFVELLGEKPGSDVSAEAVAEVRKTSENLDRVAQSRRELTLLRQRREQLVGMLAELGNWRREKLELERRHSEAQHEAQLATARLRETEHSRDTIHAEVSSLKEKIAFIHGQLSATTSDDQRVALQENLDKCELALAEADVRAATAVVAANDAREVASRADYLVGLTARSLQGVTEPRPLTEDAIHIRTELRYLDEKIAATVRLYTEDE